MIVIAYQRDGALVPVPLVPGCGIRLSETFDTFHPLAT